MATSYTRQSSFSDGDTITAALFNNEYNQLVNAFAYASSGTTGHRHDGSAAEGGNIHTIGDQDFLNKIVADSTNNRWGVFVQVSSSAVEQVRFQDGAIVPVTDNDIDLGTSSAEFKDAYFDGTVTTDALVADTADINGGTVDGATIGASSATTGVFTTIQGSTITATTAFVPDASDGAALGTSALEFSDLFLADGAVINFGDDHDVSLTHVADSVLLLSSTDQLQFGDSGTYIHQSADGVLDLVSDTEIELTATTIDINGAVAMDGAITGGTNITISGELDAATLDISGNADIDGTTNLDAVDIDGAVQIDATVTVGVDDTGYDVKFFGDTASAYMLWDASADDLVLAGAAGIDLAGDLDVDGTANLDVVDIDGAVDMASTLTLAGNADFNGDLDVDGTTNLDVVDIDGAVDMASTLTLAGNADFNGDLDVDGTANLDAVDIDGAVQIDGTVTVGVDDTGKDVKFFGATSGSYLLWDESADSLLLTDSTPIKIGDAQDMTLYHDGTNSYLTNAVGALKVATETSGIAITIGHTTSETTVADNLTVTGNASIGGDLDVTGSFDMSDANITNIGSIALDTITDDDGSITLDSSGDIVLDADGADIFFKDDGTTFGSATNSSGNLIIKSGTTTALTFSGANVTAAGTYTGGGTMTTGGNIVIPDAGNIGSASDTNALGISSGGVVSVTATTANTSATDGALTVAGGLGVAADASIGDDLRLISDAAVLSFGADSDVTLTHVADTGVLLNSTMAIQFNDASQYINAPSATVLDINATDEVEINATLADVNANLDVSGTYTGGGLMTTGGNIVIPDAGNIGSASDTDAIAISSGGAVTFSQTPVFPDGSIAIADLDIDGGTDVGADLVDADLIIVDDGAGGTNRKATLSRLKTYIGAGNADDLLTGDAAVTIATSAGDITIDAQGDNTDIIFKGTDGGADTTFLTIDGSDAGTASFNHDIKLASDSAKIDFGADGDITLQHTADDGLILKNNNTGDDSDVRLLMRTAETDIQANDILGRIQFQAINEGTGTDAILVAAEVAAVSEGDFSSSSNATKLSFKTGASEAASEKMSLSSGGDLSVSNDVKLASDAAVLNFGADNDVSLTHVADTGLLLNAAMQLQFRDSAIYVRSGADGHLDLVADTIIDVDAPNIRLGYNELSTAPWTTGGMLLPQSDGEAGLMYTHGSYRMSLMHNGYRKASSEWESLALNSADEAAGIEIDGTTGKIFFQTELNKADGETYAVTQAGYFDGSQDLWLTNDLKLDSDASVIHFGADQDVTLTHVADTGLTLSAGANHTTFEITSTEDGANAGPRLSLKRDSANPADDDDLGIIYFKGENDADEEISYARIFAEAVDVSDGTEDGKLRLQVYRAGSQTSAVTIADTVEVTGDLTATGTVFADGGMLKAEGTGTTTGTAFLTTDSAGTYCTRVLNSGSLITGTKASSPVNHTTGSAANVFVSTSGYIRKSTSSLRYKKDVQDLDPLWADKVLDFKPIFFKSDCPKVEGDSHEPDEWTYYGFAAEQVGTIDPRYVFWNREKVEWSDEGRKSTSLIDSDNPHGQAEGVQYDRITVALVDIIKRQKAAIDSLTKRVEALEA